MIVSGPIEAQSCIYKGKSTYSGDIIVTWNGKYPYQGKSTYPGDIMITWDGKYLYKGKSTYPGDILVTWEGEYLYKGKSNYSGDILYTMNGKYLYQGKSTYSGDILYALDGSISVPILISIIFLISHKSHIITLYLSLNKTSHPLRFHLRVFKNPFTLL